MLRLTFVLAAAVVLGALPAQAEQSGPRCIVEPPASASCARSFVTVSPLEGVGVLTRARSIGRIHGEIRTKERIFAEVDCTSPVYCLLSFGDEPVPAGTEVTMTLEGLGAGRWEIWGET